MSGSKRSPKQNPSRVIEASLAIQSGLDGAVAVAATPVSPPVEPAVVVEQVSFASQHFVLQVSVSAHCFIFWFDPPTPFSWLICQLKFIWGEIKSVENS